MPLFLDSLDMICLFKQKNDWNAFNEFNELLDTDVRIISMGLDAKFFNPIVSSLC